MKKLFVLCLVLFVATKVLADIVICPEGEIVCSEGTFMGDDGECYSCDTNAEIEINCIGHERVFQICPNRFTVDQECRIFSVLEEKDCQKYISSDSKINYKNHTCYDSSSVCI